MQKKRPRGKVGTQDVSGATAPVAGGDKRRARVRSRLVAGVAVVGITVIAAGAPAALGASSDLNESQNLVTLAELDQQAITLAHSLADERDAITAYIAGGRKTYGGKDGDGDDGAKPGADSLSARVDQQIDEIREAAPATLRRDLSTVPSLRRDAVGGKGSALATHQAYSEVIAKLHDLAADLAESTPPRAAAATRAPLALSTAVEQASATRGLLLAALAVPSPEPVQEYDPYTGLPVTSGDDEKSADDRARDELSAAAQQARVRELAALADFDQAAGAGARDKLSSTVTGPEVNSADKYLAALTDSPELSDADRETSSKKLSAALSARIDRMRGVESALGTAQVQRLEKLRDDDVTGLELSLALLGGCFLIAVGVSTAVARTLTQPLAVLRIGSARLAAEPESAEAIAYRGRNDEFAQVVRSINALHERLLALHGEFAGQTGGLRAEHAELIAGREALSLQRAELQVQVADLTAELQRLRTTVHHTFVNLSLRSLGLVERQLGVIENLEEREQDPERLATLFKLDHLATVMRRHGENMLVLAGADHGQGHAGPIPLVDVARAAVSEIERYERVTIQSLPPYAQVAGFAADDLSHLVAELLENATAFSPPDSRVELSGWLLETGEVMLSVQDEGIGMSAARMEEVNLRLADPASFRTGEPGDDGAGLGLQVSALLAARHGVQVRLQPQKTGGGVTAVVVLPQALLPKAPPAASPPPVNVPGGAPALNLPGSVAEANSNTLQGRSPALPAGDPLIAAAERTIRDAGADAAPAAVPAAPGEPAVAPSPAPAESPAETTMQFRLPPVPEAAPEAAPAPAPEAAPAPAPEAAPTPAPEATGNPYAIGPDRHERPADTAGTTAPAAHDPYEAPEPRPFPLPGNAQHAYPQAPPVPEPAPLPTREAASTESVPAPRQPERVTDKGLPKRTPRVVKPADAPSGERTGSLDKEALRRRLGGFQRGAREGRRDVEAEIAEGVEPDAPIAPDARTDLAGRPDGQETGDTVEEARS
ncbi:nitrate- and nitrite sensing domain-containing protein [Streptomyces sp. NBC_00102]|uniref:sensor histidine kinase n=1 Tax=Streptomyces sp. NBC_00102 TaxID=2975652 RepID=UPI002253FAE6|nr:nitrate- and nitrite sensing domain-containing protein [Streptomyces sp. NBC_00102]MCX5399719.1 nitrate- and nitrite sensing domain-containing protein [Streptomyces sp. NBC_00102]